MTEVTAPVPRQSTAIGRSAAASRVISAEAAILRAVFGRGRKSSAANSARLRSANLLSVTEYLHALALGWRLQKAGLRGHEGRGGRNTSCCQRAPPRCGEERTPDSLRRRPACPAHVSGAGTHVLNSVGKAAAPVGPATLPPSRGSTATPRMTLAAA